MSPRNRIRFCVDPCDSGNTTGPLDFITYGQAKVVYALGRMEELKAEGKIKGGPELDPQVREALRILTEEGFVLSAAECSRIVRMINDVAEEGE